MRRSFPRELAVLLFAVGIVVLFCHERQLSGFDPGSFVLSIRYGYSIGQLRPHPPGYPAFYLLWTALACLTELPPHAVILLSNSLFLLCAIVLLYFATEKIFGKKTALLATCLAATNPLLLYYSCTAELYTYDAAFSAFLVYLLLAAPSSFEVLGYFIFGLLGSFRLSSVILTLPVLATALFLRYRKTRSIQPLMRDLGAMLAGWLLWIIPFEMTVGGWAAFAHIIRVAGQLPTTLVENISTYLPFHLWMLNVVGVLFILEARTIISAIRARDERVLLLVLLIAIPTSFFLLKYYAKGYALLYLAPACILAAYLMVERPHRTRWFYSAVTVNLLIFFLLPFHAPSPASTIRHDRRTIGERWSSALWRSTSYYAPSNAHLREDDRSMVAAGELLSSVPSGAYVIVDGAAALKAHPRSLQSTLPSLSFLMPRADDSSFLQCFARDSLQDNFDLARIANGVHLYYLSIPALGAAQLPPGILLSKHGPFLLYSEPNNARDSIRSYLNALFFRGSR